MASLGHNELKTFNADHFSENIKKVIFAHYIMSQTWNRPGSWNSSLWKTTTRSSYIGDTTAADDLVTQGARASASMALTQFSRNIPATVLKGLNMSLSPLRMYFNNLCHFTKEWYEMQSIAVFLQNNLAHKVLNVFSHLFIHRTHITAFIRW